MRRAHRALGLLSTAVLVVGCSVSPVSGDGDRAPSTSTSASSPTNAQSTAPVDYTAMQRTLTERIETGSLSLATVRAVLVSVDGRTRMSYLHRGASADDAVHVWSITKSVMSALIGLAIEDEIIGGLDDTLGELLPTYSDDMTPEQRSITLRQVMTMSAGFPPDEPVETLHAVFNQRGDPVPDLLADPLNQPPGQIFDYSSRGSHLVAVVLNEALRRADPKHPRSVLDYARSRLFAPLGIDASGGRYRQFLFDDVSYDTVTRFDWGTDGAGVFCGHGALRLRPSDMIKFGELYRRGGVWNGRQVLPAGWVEQTTTPSPLTSQYGLEWWLNTDQHGHRVWQARGWGGQMIAVVPDHRLVVAAASIPTTADGEISSSDIWALVNDVVISGLG